MKAIMLISTWVVLVSSNGFGFGLVNNSTVSVTAEDSLCIPFFNLDSLGRSIGGLDTTKVMAFYPNGDSAFCEAVAGVIGRVKVSVDNGDTVYRWTAQVSEIDGTGGAGLYAVKITAKSDQTGGWLTTSRTSSFQLINQNFNDILQMTIDSLKAVLDSVQNFHNWVGNVRYTNPDSTLSIKRFAASGANGSNGSFYIYNSNGTAGIFNAAGGTGENAFHGLSISGSNAGAGIRSIGGIQGHGAVFGGGASSGNGIQTYAYNGDGIRSFAITSGNGISADGAGTGFVDIAAPEFADTIANRVLEDSLHYQGSFSGGGSGPISVQVLAYDSSLEQIIPGVNVAIRNIEQTALIALNGTGTDGKAAFNLAADSFLAVAFAPGYIFESYDTLIVEAANVDTIWGWRFDPGNPSAPELCRVYGFLYDISGNPENGAVVTAWLPSGVGRKDNSIISPFKTTALSDSAGYFYLDLIPNEKMIPANSKYEITITRTDGTILRQRVVVPESPSWLLTW
ncbi:hypothetical protein TRIP_C20551 [Candidatus Zixiibacteriota bacterium]|nr:hypothetical protein TRIP_C20551 [candidate division Zixibacteria bacterium]